MSEFRRECRRQMRSVPANDWRPWPEIWALMRDWFKAWDISIAVSQNNAMYAEHFLDLVELLGEYLSVRPSPELAGRIVYQIRLAINYARKEADGKYSPVATEVLQICDRCLYIVEAIEKKPRQWF